MHKHNLKKRFYVVRELNSSVQSLDAYIKHNEKSSNEQLIENKNVSKRRIRLLKYIDRLIEAIEREEFKKKEAFEYLKASNETMKKTISKLQDSINRENAHVEFQRLDNLNTERLLKIDPKVF